MLEFVALTVVVTVICICIVNHLGRSEQEKQQEKFDREFFKEESIREQKVYQAKLEGSLNIDKLIEIYYPDKKPIYNSNGEVISYL